MDGAAGVLKRSEFSSGKYEVRSVKSEKENEER
jgi:hypothetical protein